MQPVTVGIKGYEVKQDLSLQDLTDQWTMLGQAHLSIGVGFPLFRQRY